MAYQQAYIPQHGINFSSGNKYLLENDITLAGPIAPLSFSRSYNSQSVEDTLLGFGWSFSWSENLTFYPDLDMVVYTRSDGKMIHFTQNGTDVWINDVWKKASIRENEESTGYILTRPDGTLSLFDTEGRLTEKRDLNNNSIFLTYAGENLTTIFDGFGRSLSLVYNSTGKLESIVSPAGTYSYAYDANNNLVSALGPDNALRTYLYEDPKDIHNLTGVVDETSTRTHTVGYDNLDRVISSSLTGGSGVLSIAYQPGYKRVITNSLGIATTYQLEALHGVAQVKSVSGPGCSSCGSDSGSQYTYDFRQQVTSIIDGRGIPTVYTYDDNGNKLTETKALGTPEEYRTSYTYDGTKVKTISLPSVANPGQNRILSMDYDAAGNLLSRTETGSNGSDTITRTTSFTNDSIGRVTSINGPRTDVNDLTAVTYYPNTSDQGSNRGFLKQMTNSLGHSVVYSQYNGFGKPELITANNLATQLSYNPQGLLISRTIGGLVTAYDYDAAGRLLSISLPDARTIGYQYNPAGQVSRIIDSLGNAVSYTYDSEGKKTGQKISDPLGVLTAYTDYAYDDDGRLNKILYPDDAQQVFGYDAVDNLTSRINPLGKTTSYGYDALNRLINITEPGSVATSFTYDLHGNQTSVMDGESRKTTFTFDDFGNRISRISKDTGTTTYAYDVSGNLIEQTDANQVVTAYTYDALNRLTAVTYPDASLNISYTYDQGVNGIGHLTGVIDATGSATYTYNTHGSLIEEVRTIGDQTFHIGYGYNQSQELTSITYPGGRVVNYQRDATGQTTSVTSTDQGKTTTLVDGVTYLPFGPTTAMTLGNGLTLGKNYDQQYRLTGSTAGDIYNRNYAYLSNGQVASITDALDDTRSKGFVYDDLDRLVSATGSQGRFDYSYDRVGNRLSMTQDSEQTLYTYQPGTNRLGQTIGSQTLDYTYDAAGNPLSKGDLVFTWNKSNRLEHVAKNAETMGRYGYDARGLRTVKTTADGTFLSLYDISGNLIAEVDDTGALVKEYVYLDGQRLTLFDYMPAPEFTVSVTTSNGEKLEGVNTYAFDQAGRYTGSTAKTDAKGQALFDRSNFGQGPYTFRVDYLGTKFWSEQAIVQQSSQISVVIDVNKTAVTISMDNEVKEGVKVYAFTEAGSYLGINGTTNLDGQVLFSLPTGENYKFRADLYGTQYWSDITTIEIGTCVAIATGGGLLSFTVQKEVGQPMAGIKTYLFSEAGAYLGISQTTDEQGQVSYRVPRGSYTIRTDYLGYQFMSEIIPVAADTAFNQIIAHEDIQVTVVADAIPGASGLEGVICYLFSPTGSYLGIRATTNENGQALFNLPRMPYRIRADYLKQQYWSEDLTWQNTAIAIAHGTAVVRVTQMDDPLNNVPVYVFTESGTYLNRSGITDNQGEIRFDLPGGTYRFRTDYQGSQYWGNGLALVPHEENPVQISTGGGSFELTVTRGEGVPMEGIRTYAFTETGTYLGVYANTDNNGRAGFNLADGNFKIRMDYLDHQYWTDLFVVPTVNGINFTIPHRQVQVNAYTEFNGATVPLDGAKVYLFSPQNSYQNINATTDSNGQAFFDLPEQGYKVRVDYLGKQYMSDPFAGEEITISIEQGQARIHLSSNDTELSGVPVYVFSESDSYLGITGHTAADGSVLFQLPAGVYKFRADYQSSQFWAPDLVVADTVRDIDLSTGGGSLAVTVRTAAATVLPNVTCYLFSQAGAYLGQNAKTDDNGMVRFDVVDGGYKIRIDYLGYQYWSNDVEVPSTLSTSVLIEKQDVLVTVIKDQSESQLPLPGIKCYLFTESGSYTSISAATDENGQAHFNLPNQSYKIRADYLGSQYWSDPFAWSNSTIAIAHGKISLSVTLNNTATQGAKAYLFSETGSYLGMSGTTDNNGNVQFMVPGASYQIRVDVDGKQNWTETLNILPLQDNVFELHLNDENQASTDPHNPHSKRWDGEPPIYQLLFASLGELPSGALAQTTQLEVSDEARPLWYIVDHLGTAQVITDESGAVVWQGYYQPFGGIESGVGQAENRFRFPGQYFDGETGLHYNWHRYYDPDTGRYLTPDPIGLAGGINLFAYAANNPVNYIDPFGLDYLVTNSGTGIITHFNDDGYEGNSYPYTSGRDGITDPSIPWKGPIPPGEYTLNPSEISEGGWLRDLTGDWGNYRVPLHPNDETDTLNRDNFFLHGGDKPGSGGCIDVGPNDTHLLGPNNPIGNHDGPVTVIVK